MPISSDRILYADDHLLMVNKLSGELVVKGAGKVQKLPLLDFLKKEYPGLRPLNRLDYETSGIVVFARTKEAYEAAREAVDKWEKTYRTLVKGNIKYKKGSITKPLPARSSKALLPTETRYRVVRRFALCDEVECVIRTGRHHQIRKHLAGIYHPLVLDNVYGDQKFNRIFQQRFRFKKFFLHAEKLQMDHPITGEKLLVEAEMPPAMAEVLGKMG